MALKVAVITGAGTGIGAAVSRALAGDGFVIALAGRRTAPLEEVAGEIGAEKCLVVQADVGKLEDVQRLFRSVREKWGRCDFLFNNAGVGAPPVPLEELPFETWQNVVNTNLTGSFLCTQEAIKMMKENGGGRIVNNGSISAHAPRPFSVAYTATKHAITGLTKSTSLDCRKYNIACGQIDIGNALTPIFSQLSAAPSTESTDSQSQTRMGPPMLQPDGSRRAEPMMDVKDVADAVLMMARMPLDTNVQFITIMARDMPFVGRG